MEAIRKIVTVKNNELKIQLPPDFNGKEVEVTILSFQEDRSTVNEAKYNYKKFYGSVKLNISREQIDKELNELRNEWDRDIS